MNRERSDFVDRQHVGSTDRDLFFFKLYKASHEVSHNKTKVPNEFIFRNVSHVCFTPKLDE